MSASPAAQGPADSRGLAEPRVPSTHWLRPLLRNPVAVGCLSFLIVLTVCGLAAELLAPYDPNDAELAAVNAAPLSEGHLLGGDGSGRDILSRLLWGTQQTLLACVFLLVASAPLGIAAGLFAGYRRGPADVVASGVSDVLLSMPGVVLLIALYSLTGPSLAAAMTLLGVLIAPSYFRLVRGVVLGVRKELYVDAAKVVGLSDLRIVGRHVMWAVRAPIIIQTSFVLATGIAVQAAIDFIGLGDPAKASWGSVLQESFGNIYTNGWSVVWPAALISLTTLALVLLGNALRDALQPGSAKRPLSSRQREAVTARLSPKTPQEPVAVPRSENGALLSVHGLRIAYARDESDVREVVQGVDLEVRKGEIRGLVGESGSGKTQTAFAILGILGAEALIDGGSVVFDGQELLHSPTTQARVRGRRIAYVPQEPMSNLDPSFTVGSQLVYGLRATKQITRAQAKQEILALLARVGIKDPQRVFDLYPHEVSGGMAQRVLICGAVAAGPDLLIADEPTTALDVTVQAEVLDLLRELRDERGLGVLLVTHNFGVVADLCDTVSVMKDGRIVESGETTRIFRAPQHPYTRELLVSVQAVEIGEVIIRG